MAPKVSVIVPIYNVDKYLRRCVDSILTQTFTDFELLLIDDGSRDGSPVICDEYVRQDSRVRVFHKYNGGLTTARNHGLDRADGEWICHIDGDDWVSSEYLEQLLDTLERNNADIALCDLIFAYPDGKKLVHTTYSWAAAGIEGLSEYIATGWTTLCGSICKKELYTRYGFRSPERISYCEDFHLMVRLISKAGKVAKVNEPLYYYRQRGGSIMHNLDKKTEADELWAYLDTIDYLKQKGIYDALRRPMAWRTLKATQDMVLDPTKFKEFICTNPDKKDHILDCPFINRKQKIMMWCLTHRLSACTYIIAKTRKLLGR